MKRKSAVISLVIAFVMLITVFAVNVPQADAAVDKNTYWIKVNTQCNVVTVYKKAGSTYKPIRAMVCSCGKKGHETPKGTYRMGTKIGWCYLVGNVWGRYSMVIKGNYLFHSVPYAKKSINSMKYKEYNKLGTNCSHGCVRLSLMDAKWIWNKCPKGTKITVYKSKNPGPLGKPTPIKMKSSWKYDPTDPSKKNPNFKLKKPVITVSSSKPKTIEQGCSYSIKSGVTGKNPNANQNLTSYIKVYKTYKYSTSKKKYIRADFTTKKTGKYKITYKLYSYYCGGTTYKSFYVKVIDPEAITIDAVDREVVMGSDEAANAVLNVTAKQKSSDRTKYMTVKILKPGAAKSMQLTYKEAQNFVFDKEGEYKVTYTAKNVYYPYKSTSKTIYVKCIAPEVETDEELDVDADDNVNIDVEEDKVEEDITES